MLRKAFVVVVVLLFLGSPAMAIKLTVARACAANVATLCKGVQPGAGRIRSCIESHFGDLSGVCQTVVMKAAAIGKACVADVRKFCASVKPGGGRIEACMKSHAGDLTDSCKGALTRAVAGRN
jgi:hypothetical protein